MIFEFRFLSGKVAGRWSEWDLRKRGLLKACAGGEGVGTEAQGLLVLAAGEGGVVGLDEGLAEGSGSGGAAAVEGAGAGTGGEGEEREERQERGKRGRGHGFLIFDF